MTDSTTLILLDSFITSHTKVIRNTNVLTDVDLSELFEIETSAIHLIIEANITKFKNDSIFVLTEDEIPGPGVRYVFSDPGVFILAGLIKSKRAIRIYVQLIELLVNKLQDRAYELATSYQPDKVW
jgi:hypothetical protein